MPGGCFGTQTNVWNALGQPETVQILVGKLRPAVSVSSFFLFLLKRNAVWICDTVEMVPEKFVFFYFTISIYVFLVKLCLSSQFFYFSPPQRICGTMEMVTENFVFFYFRIFVGLSSKVLFGIPVLLFLSSS